MSKTLLPTSFSDPLFIVFPFKSSRIIMTPAIRVENLGKCYRVNHAEERLPYKTLRDTLTRVATAPIRRFRASGHYGVAEEFWALKDVSFDVRPGEVVGIIGRNGAGKSTLLKILSRITSPTTGRVTVRGRVGSLLEVGTGFHPELTGRENIYMNGSILGMSRSEIRQKFDEIVDFSGVEKFLDTPIKRYSSGMQVRLAFAVAANLDPEILIVDEVLAVGDAEFQKKCMGKMHEVSSGGRTVLFVSHNMAAVEALCTTGILMSNGRVASSGDIADIIREYSQQIFGNANVGLVEFSQANRARQPVRFLYAGLVDEDKKPMSYLSLGGDFRLLIGISSDVPLQTPSIGIGFDDALARRVLTVHTPRGIKAGLPELQGVSEVECRIERFPLAPGDYWVKLAISSSNCELDSVEGALCFSISNGEAFGEGNGFSRGLCIAPSIWQCVNSSC
jgi:lipopolysaccharide transport system ATP-binding protein